MNELNREDAKDAKKRVSLRTWRWRFKVGWDGFRSALPILQNFVLFVAFVVQSRVGWVERSETHRF